MRRTKILFLTMILILVFLSSGYADELSELRAEMQAMEERHQKEIAQLKARIEALEDKEAKEAGILPAKAEAPQEMEKRVSALEERFSKKDILIPRWKDSLTFTTEDKQFEVKIGGRLHLDSVWFNPESKVEDKVGSIKDGAETRRAHLAIKGSMYEDYIYQIEYDFAPANPLMRDSYLGLKNVPYLGTVRAGHFFEPFGMDNLTSTNYMTFLENPLPNLAFAPLRNLGIAATSTAFNERMEWEAGIFRDADNQGRAISNEYNLTGRLTVLPWYKDKGEKLLHIGVAYSLRHPKQTLQYSAKPEANLSPNFVNTGSFNAKSNHLLGYEATFLSGPFSLQAEYIGNIVDQGGDRHDTYFQGLYLQASYLLTGETKPYLKPYGVFGRVRPKKNFSLKDKTWGAWEAALRYSYLDLDEDNINGGILSDVTLGLNWYLNPNMRIMLNYIYANRNGYGNADIVQTRFQVDF